MLSGYAWLYVVFYGFVANLPAWLAASHGGITLVGWFNLDYFAVGLIALFLPRAVSAVVLFGAIVADLIAEVCATYYLSPIDLLHNVAAVASMPAGRIVAGCALVLLVLAVVCGTFLLPRVQRRAGPAILLSVFALVCGVSDRWELYSQDGFTAMIHQAPLGTVRVSFLNHFRPARMSIRQLTVVQGIFQPQDSPSSSSGPVESASAIALRSIRTSQRPDIVMVLVESWGLSLDSAVRDALVQPYRDSPSSKFTILEGKVPFQGSTISGEGRELCNSAIGRDILHAPEPQLRDCLPNRLQTQGFRAVAVHGMNGNFYSRQQWYPRAGFQEIWFGPELRSAGLPDCVGAFVGTCDTAIAGWIGEKLDQPDSHPRFVYWVTLNSHLPVSNPPPLDAPASCTGLSNLSGDLALCNWYRLVLNVHQSVASLAAHRTSRPTVYVVVGDHAPPFADERNRRSFDQNLVPYMILVPKAAAGGSLIASHPGMASDHPPHPGT